MACHKAGRASDLTLHQPPPLPMSLRVRIGLQAASQVSATVKLRGVKLFSLGSRVTMRIKLFQHSFATSVWMIVTTAVFSGFMADAKDLSFHPRHNYKQSHDWANQIALTNALIGSCGYGNSDGNLQKIDSLLKAGARINAQDSAGRTALTQAAGARHPRIVQFLLRNGARVNLNATGNAEASQDGGNALGFALSRFHDDRADHFNDAKKTAQWVAADVLIVRILKKAGARKPHIQSR